ncbi:hypothetical protein Agub_g11287, partial [Astrephomene gubernaculifera]
MDNNLNRLRLGQAQDVTGQQQRLDEEGRPGPGTRPTTTMATQEPGPNRCQVDNCDADLKNLRRYFRRYHVCETHIRAQVVHIRGCEVRFCDQCSTFHPLSYFDGTRRTCREKLEYNRMRRRARKAQSTAAGQGQAGRAAAAPNSAAATGGAPGPGGGSGDDVDSDDQPASGRGSGQGSGQGSGVGSGSGQGSGQAADSGGGGGAASPSSRGTGAAGRGQARKRQSGVQESRRQQQAARQASMRDVTGASHGGLQRT